MINNSNYTVTVNCAEGVGGRAARVSSPRQSENSMIAPPASRSHSPSGSPDRPQELIIMDKVNETRPTANSVSAGGRRDSQTNEIEAQLHTHGHKFVRMFWLFTGFGLLSAVLMGCNVIVNYSLESRQTEASAIIYEREVLTMSAKMAVLSGDVSHWQRRYTNHLAPMSDWLQTIQSDFGSLSQNFSGRLSDVHAQLTQLDTDAVQLASINQPTSARALVVFNASYESIADSFNTASRQLLDYIVSTEADKRESSQFTTILICIFAGAFVVFGTLIVCVMRAGYSELLSLQAVALSDQPWTMERIVTNQSAFEVFRAFLEVNHSAELGQFLAAISQLRVDEVGDLQPQSVVMNANTTAREYTLTPPQQRLYTDLNTLCAQYIVRGAPDEVNIPDTMRMAIVHAMERKDLTGCLAALWDAQQEVMLMLMGNFYGKFLVSPGFMEFLDKRNDAMIQRLTLRAKRKKKKIQAQKTSKKHSTAGGGGGAERGGERGDRSDRDRVGAVIV